MKNYNRFVLYSMRPTVAHRINNNCVAGFFTRIYTVIVNLFNRSG
jgi:hypothetical protein